MPRKDWDRAYCAQLRREHPDWLAKDVAAVVGVRPETAARWARLDGDPYPSRVERARASLPPDAEVAAERERRREAGQRYDRAVLAREYGVSEAVIRNALARAGVLAPHGARTPPR